jgi:hypothetical protein
MVGLFNDAFQLLNSSSGNNVFKNYVSEEVLSGYQPAHSLTSEPDGGEWLISRPCRFTSK